MLSFLFSDHNFDNVLIMPFFGIRKPPGCKYFMPDKCRFQFHIHFSVMYYLKYCDIDTQSFITNVINIHIFSIKYNE